MLIHSYGEPYSSVHITCMKGEPIEDPHIDISGLVGFDSS